MRFVCLCINFRNKFSHSSSFSAWISRLVLRPNFFGNASKIIPESSPIVEFLNFWPKYLAFFSEFSLNVFPFSSGSFIFGKFCNDKKLKFCFPKNSCSSCAFPWLLVARSSFILFV